MMHVRGRCSFVRAVGLFALLILCDECVSSTDPAVTLANGDTPIDSRLTSIYEELGTRLPVDDLGYTAKVLAAAIYHGAERPAFLERSLWYRIGTEAVEVLVHLEHDGDVARLHMASIREGWYRDVDDVMKNINSDFTMELVEGALIAEFVMSFPAPAAIELLAWAEREIGSASEDALCQEPLLNGMNTHLIVREGDQVSSVECLCQWSYRPYGGLSDVLLGLVGLTVDRVMRSPETVLSDR